MLVRVIHYLAFEVEVRDDELEAKQAQATLRSQAEHLASVPIEEAAKSAGTLMVKKSHWNVKLVIKWELSDAESKATFTMMRKCGFVIRDGKPPRSGMHRALQAEVGGRR